MKRSTPSRASHLRQALHNTEEQRAQRVHSLLAERGPLIRGSFVEQAIPCGKPGCKCLRGEPHPRAMLYLSDKGTHSSAYVPQADRVRVGQANRQYQQFRKARAALAKLGNRSLELADALQQALLEPYPPPERVRTQPSQRRRTSKRETSS